MPLTLDLKRKLTTRSERIKSVDFHATEPWVLSASYGGVITIHNWEEQVAIKSVDVCLNTVIRCAKFISSKDWIVCGSDDTYIRVFDCNLMQKIESFEAHTDFIRHIAIHPTLPLVLTCSDDMTIRLWDWSRGWVRVAIFEGHSHYVMMCCWNPKDSLVFATASMDRTIKFWSVPSNYQTVSNITISSPNYTLLGHESGVDCIEFFNSSEKPYIVSGGDDKSIRVWDYQTKQCITMLKEHTKIVTTVAIHPNLPVIISGSEDGHAKFWHSNAYRQELSLNLEMGRVWQIKVDPNSLSVAFATDEGVVVMKIGNEKPIVSMHGFKVILSKGNDFYSINLKTANLTDDAYRELPATLMGSSEFCPQFIQHHPNGRLVGVAGCGEYIIYTTQALRNTAYGKALGFAWSNEGHYAVRNELGKVSVYLNSSEHGYILPKYTVQGIFGGTLLGIKSHSFLCFYDWNTLKLKRTINVKPEEIYWCQLNNRVAICCETVAYILKYDANASEENYDEEEGIESAFEVETEIKEKIESGVWLQNVFIYTTSRPQIYLIVEGYIEKLKFLDKPAWIIGYYQETNKLVLIDRNLFFITVHVSLPFINYMNAICSRDFESASKHLEKLPKSLYDKVARFLESQGQRDVALEIVQDLDYKFELSKKLGRLDLCASILKEAVASRGKDGNEYYLEQWAELGNLAVDQGAVQLAEACFLEARDFSSLLVIYSSMGNKKGLEHLSNMAVEKNDFNIAFICFFMIKDLEKCVEILLKADKIPEAALFARTYIPSKIPEIVTIWRQKLSEVGLQKIAVTLLGAEKVEDVVPSQYLQGFEDLNEPELNFQDSIFDVLTSDNV